MLREMSERKRGLGSWVIALICCLTPDTKASPRFITHMEREVKKKQGGGIKNFLKKQLSTPSALFWDSIVTFCQTSPVTTI